MNMLKITYKSLGAVVLSAASMILGGCNDFLDQPVLGNVEIGGLWIFFLFQSANLSIFLHLSNIDFKRPVKVRGI